MAISYSQLKLYQQCPARHRYKYLLRLPEAEGTDRAAAERGKLLHSAAEAYVNKETDDLPFELMKWEKVLLKLREDGVLTEQTLYLDADFKPCGKEDAYIIAIIDTLQLDPPKAEVGDWKTGAIRSYDGQLKFYSTVVMSYYPEVDTVSTRLRFIDKGKSAPGEVYTRQRHYSGLVEETKGLIKRMESDRIRAPNPSSLCPFCPYNKRVGGPCKW